MNPARPRSGAALEVAFPVALRAAAADVARVVIPVQWSPRGEVAVRVDGEPVVLPYRLSAPEPAPATVAALPVTQRTMLACLYTRHDDGYVRQRHLRGILGATHPWVAPFVVQLVGEYVIEIVRDVRAHLVGVDEPGSALRAVYGAFAAENRAFLELTGQRAASYWDCYHRGRYPARPDYPAFDVLRRLRAAARDRIRSNLDLSRFDRDEEAIDRIS